MDVLGLETYAIEIRLILRELGIPESYATDRRLELQVETNRSVSAGRDIYDRELRLTPEGLEAWNNLRSNALKDGIVLQVISGFRRVSYQRGIIERKLATGLHIQEILKSSAAPGFSEHHTGRALDLTTPGATVLHSDFEHTAAFVWLARNAAFLGFRMSFPRGNPHGIIYEPWHWYFQG